MNVVEWFEVHDRTEVRDTFEDWQLASAMLRAQELADDLGHEVSVERCVSETYASVRPRAAVSGG